MANIQIQDVRNICCIGATKVGVLSTLIAAEKWPQKKFIIVDNQKIIDLWMGDKGLRYFEPGLPQLLAAQNQVNVNFETPNYHNQVNLADMVVIAVEVNTKMEGLGKRKRLDLGKWDRVMRDVLFVAQQPKVIVIKSQLPADDALTAVGNIISSVRAVNATAIEHHIFWVPEFFSAGTALQSLRKPTRVVITTCHPLNNNNPNTGLISDLYLTAPTGWVLNRKDIIITSTSSGILGAMATNVMLAFQATVMNAMSEMCEELPDCDINEVERIMNSDPRLNGNQNLRASAGFGGPGLLRDLAFFTHLAEVRNMKPAAQLFNSIIKCNREHQEYLVTKMLKSMNMLQNNVVCILGFSYKENTNDVINSPAIHICRQLCLKGVAEIRIYDPHVSEEDILACFSTKVLPHISVEQNLEAMWRNTEVICFLQHWNEFDNLNWQQISNQIQIPAQIQQTRVVHLFDTCNVLRGQLENIQAANNLNTRFRIHISGRPTI